MSSTRGQGPMLAAAAVVLAASPIGCMQEQPEATARLDIQVAPLVLNGIGNAEYTIVVANSVPQTVWSKTVTSDQYGDGIGSISYVGPCDAQAKMHTVTLTLDKLWDSNDVLLVSPSDYKNPGPITLVDIECKENTDVPVIFNLTIMRAAIQGFFDIAVNFKDVFCSAKVDCQPELLFDGDKRSATVVMGLACSTGMGTNGPEPTWMYLTNLRLLCEDAPGGADLDSIVAFLNIGGVVAPGNQGAKPPAVFQWAQYQGMEEFGDFDKCYWNHAIGLDLEAIGARKCTLSGTATASDEILVNSKIAPDVVWPIIDFSVEVVKPDGTLCGPNPLDGDPSGVTTSYVTPGMSTSAFSAAYHCGGRPTAAGFKCSNEPNAYFQPTTVGADAAVEVIINGVRAPAPFVLPVGAKLASGCCLASCCERTRP